MTFQETLVEAGFSGADAENLAADERFRQRNTNKTAAEISEKIASIAGIYSIEKPDIRNAILTHPRFAGLDHQRVLRQRSKLGRLVGLDENEVKERIFGNPVLAGCSAKRYLAALDIGRQLKTEGIQNNNHMLRIWFNNVSKSPYVPGTDRLRITQAQRRGVYTAEPPLMTVLRRNLDRERREKVTVT